MAGYQHILLDKDPVEHRATLIVNRPQRRNAINDLTMDELGDALEDAHSVDSILNRLVPQEDQDQVAVEIPRTIAAAPPIAMRLSKLKRYQGLAFDQETAMKMAAAKTITLRSRDHGEGTQAIR